MAESPSVRQFEDLEVWKRSRALVGEIYRATKSGTFSQDRGLSTQIQRAAISIASNIAEGFERDGNREFTQFLSLAKGSSGEVRAQLHLARDQSYLSRGSYQRLIQDCSEISKMLSGLIRYVRQSGMRGPKHRSPA